METAVATPASNVEATAVQTAQTPAQPAGWIDSVPQDIRTNPEWEGTLRGIQEKYKTPEEITKGLLHTYRDYGKKQEGVIRVPGADAKPEEQEAFQQAIRKYNGVPEKPDDYKHNFVLKSADDSEVPAKLDDVTDQFVRGLLHKRGLGNDAYEDIVKGIYELNQQAVGDSNKKLQDTWGHDYIGKNQAVKAEIERISDPQLKADLQDAKEHPLVQRIVDYFIQGRKEDGIPDVKAAQGGQTMTKQDAQIKMDENYKAMWTLDRNSEQYKKLDAENENLLKFING